ncbi:four helix bundle protein [Candidatus Viridilinea mediisalina]|uniref:Four helix bundle protein n=1 Tax=Candidatus Viridilinea mediisalina TaxID=2024553 RepID=A0A2A6RMH5_9CHLR|nr:four helix bundle protein [Candidatus Viridilinea mediisalina]PDW04059.1 four helix bundle protein [Candidatus Viridilinea mediisalina]
MSKISSHRDLHVWQKGIDLVEQIYRITDKFPPKEAYRLTSQITRAAISVPANIAEGHGRSMTGDYARFLSIAKGSLMETETLLMISVRLGYIKEAEETHIFQIITDMSKMLTSLRNKLLSK